MRYGLMMSAAVLAHMIPAIAFAQKPQPMYRGVLTCTFRKAAGRGSEDDVWI